MLADALAPFGGIVMWRAFVYDADVDPDRVNDRTRSLFPRPLLQIECFCAGKERPLDFQPREPVQPLFGAMPNTPMMLELQYSGISWTFHSSVVSRPMWKEYFESTRTRKGKAQRSLPSSMEQRKLSDDSIAGVTNIGDDRTGADISSRRRIVATEDSRGIRALR